MGGVKLRNGLCREMSLERTRFFFPQGSKKKRETSLFRFVRLFFSFCLSFSKSVKSVKEAAPGEREPRENELLPSSYFPHHHLGAVFEKVITEKTTTSEDVIYILTHTHV